MSIIIFLLFALPIAFVAYAILESYKLKKSYIQFLNTCIAVKSLQLKELEGSSLILKRGFEKELDRFNAELNRVTPLIFFTTSDCRLWQEITKETSDI